MIDHSKPPCKECGSYDNERHHPYCSKASDEQKIRGYLDYYEAWLRENAERNKMYTRLSKDITFWQGKYRIVKHENNKLRKALYQKNKKEKNNEN